jgi:hypothetical protein
VARSSGLATTTERLSSSKYSFASSKGVVQPVLRERSACSKPFSVCTMMHSPASRQPLKRLPRSVPSIEKK